MKAEFNHTSKWIYLFVLLTALSLFFLFPDREWSAYLYSLAGVVLCISIPGSFISYYSIWNYDAKDDKVIFSRTILPKNKTIMYREISYIKVTRRYFITRGGKKWEETIHFILNDNEEICFSAAIPVNYDKIDLPTYAEVQFDNSKFSQLKRYIESKMNIQEENKNVKDQDNDRLSK